MHVTCPSCKFGGTVRDDQIPPDGKEVYCPNCNVKFRIRKDRASRAGLPRAGGDSASARTDQSEYLPVTCPACGFAGKLKRGSVAGVQSKKIVCPSCKNPFTFIPPNAASSSGDGGKPGLAGTDSPISCPDCGSPIQHLLPVCPSCGRVLAGKKIYCPACKSANVGIRTNSRDDGESRWETTLFKPLAVSIENPEDLAIPLSCRDCGKTWTVKPSLPEAIEETAQPSHEEN